MTIEDVYFKKIHVKINFNWVVMNENYYEIAQKIVNKIAIMSGFTNDVSLFDGKMGNAILLFQSSKYFSSVELENIAESLIADIIEDERNLDYLCQHWSSEVFWGLSYLSYSNFIEIDSNFFDDVDKLLLKNIDDYPKVSFVKYPFLGNYILMRYKTSDDPNYWKLQAKVYFHNMLKMIDLNIEIYIKNVNLLTPFLYILLKWKEKEIDFEITNEKFEELRLLLDKLFNKIPLHFKKDPCFQFYNTFNNIQFEYDPSYFINLTDVNAIFLNKLIYPDFIMPSINEINEILANVVSDKSTLQELESFFSYQNVGITGYLSGLGFSLIQYLQLSERALLLHVNR